MFCYLAEPKPTREANVNTVNTQSSGVGPKTRFRGTVLETTMDLAVLLR